MSSSDLTEKNKLESMRNIMNTKDASCKIKKKKINNIRCIDIFDPVGNYVQKSWFNVLIPNGEFMSRFPAATIVLSTSSPILFSVVDGKTVSALFRKMNYTY